MKFMVPNIIAFFQAIDFFLSHCSDEIKSKPLVSTYVFANVSSTKIEHNIARLQQFPDNIDAKKVSDQKKSTLCIGISQLISESDLGVQGIALCTQTLLNVAKKFLTSIQKKVCQKSLLRTLSIDEFESDFWRFEPKGKTF